MSVDGLGFDDGGGDDIVVGGDVRVGDCVPPPLDTITDRRKPLPLAPLLVDALLDEEFDDGCETTLPSTSICRLSRLFLRDADECEGDPMAFATTMRAGECANGLVDSVACAARLRSRTNVTALDGSVANKFYEKKTRNENNGRLKILLCLQQYRQLLDWQ